jgi:flagella basal body P-ring formation protein FlgA
MTAPVLLALAAGCLSLPAGRDEITAGDLAARAPAFAAVEAASRIGFAPAPGARRLFSAAELRRLAARLGVADAAIAGDVCVERAVRPLDPARLVEAMRKALPEARIELKDYSRYPAPEGEIEFARAALQPSGLWTGAVRYGKSRRFAIWARVSAEVSRRQVIALETLPAGKPIAAAQVKVEAVEGRPGAMAAAQSLEEVVGRAPRRTLAKGVAVPRALLVEPPDIERGDKVTVEVRQGAARLETAALAETSGRVGERIALRNPETKRRFLARVEGKGRAVVEPGGER